MQHYKLCLIAALLIATTACNSDQNQQAEGVIPEHQLKALEKAKNVDKLLLEAEQARSDTMDASDI